MCVVKMVDVDAEVEDGDIRTLQRLDALAYSLKELCSRATVDLVLKVGALVVTHLCGGSIELWQRVGTLRPSYRALAARSDLALSPSALCRAVSIYALVERLGGRERWRRIGTSHFQEVLPLEAQDQEQLLLAAEVQGWTVARLRAAVKDARDRAATTRNGNPSYLRRVAVQLAQYRESLHAVESREVEHGEVTKMLEEIRCIREELAVLESTANTAERHEGIHLLSDVSETTPQRICRGCARPLP